MSVARKLSILAMTAAFACGPALAQAPAAPAAAPAFPVELLKMMQAAQPAQGAAHADHEEECNASAIASWMPKGQPVDWDSLPNAKVDAAQVHAVKADVAGATARLASADASALSPADAARFTGLAAAQLKPARAGLSPYLVRAVYPVPDSEVRVTWYGDYLEVFSVGDGCAPFANTPVVVFLDRTPKQVFAMVANGHGSGN